MTDTTWVLLKGDGFLELRQKERPGLSGYLYAVKGEVVGKVISGRGRLRNVRWLYGTDRAEVTNRLLAHLRVPKPARQTLLEEVASCP